jgi:hypothetical protein
MECVPTTSSFENSDGCTQHPVANDTDSASDNPVQFILATPIAIPYKDSITGAYNDSITDTDERTTLESTVSDPQLMFSH